MVAKDTDEVQFSARRRRFLVDQGYEFHVIPDYRTLIPDDKLSSLLYHSLRDQQELLQILKQQDDEVGLDEVLEIGADDLASEYQKNKKAGADRSKAKEKEAAVVKEKKRNAIFKSWRKGN